MTNAIPTYAEFCQYLGSINFQELLAKHKACAKARVWVGGKTAEQAWEQCPQADWMLWLASRILREQELKQEIVRAAADIARTALVHTTDARVHDCLAAVERWLAGEQVDLHAAEDTADAAADAADRTARAAAYAAAVAAAAAAWTARAPARAAEAAARAAADAQHAANADIIAAQAQHADIVRKHLPWKRIRPLLERAIQETP